eukprot:6511508-Heterocapsa_arctica.AAC.1
MSRDRGRKVLLKEPWRFTKTIERLLRPPQPGWLRGRVGDRPGDPAGAPHAGRRSSHLRRRRPIRLLQ